MFWIVRMICIRNRPTPTFLKHLTPRVGSAIINYFYKCLIIWFGKKMFNFKKNSKWKCLTYRIIISKKTQRNIKFQFKKKSKYYILWSHYDGKFSCVSIYTFTSSISINPLKWSKSFVISRLNTQWHKQFKTSMSK